MYSPLNEILELFKEKYYILRSYMENIKAETPNNKFKGNYAARDLLNEMKNVLIKRIDSCGSEECFKENSMLAAIYYLHGCISMDVDETNIAQESLNEAMELTKSNSTDMDNILTVVSCLNQLGLLWCERGDYVKALEYLRESEAYYKNLSLDDEPTEFEKLLTGITGKEKGSVALEKLHTLTLYYLAQCLGASGDSVKAASYCHGTLKRQLISPGLDKADWSLNAATLSQVLIERNAFREARNHLAAASHLLEIMRTDLENVSNPVSESHMIELEILSEREAEVARCWVKYCLNLIMVSRDRLLDDDNKPSPPPDEFKSLVFESSDTGEFESQISCSFILTWEDATSLYKQCLSWLEKASKYYTLDSHVSDHVSIIRDHSQLYMVLTFFNDDISQQCKMHKRRLDMLKTVSEELSPKYYIDLLRQIWFEMGETYITMIDLKSDKVPEDKNIYIAKINNIIKQAISTFQRFIDSFKDHKGKYEEGYERGVLLSMIHSAKLLTKIQTDDTKELVLYNNSAYKHYKDIVDYCDRWSSDALLEGELLACREMANLLPLKLGKLAAKIN